MCCTGHEPVHTQQGVPTRRGQLAAIAAMRHLRPCDKPAHVLALSSRRSARQHSKRQPSVYLTAVSLLGRTSQTNNSNQNFLRTTGVSDSCCETANFQM